MKYTHHEIDDFSFMQPKNLLTKEDEHDLLKRALVIMGFMLVVAIFNLEHWGVVDAAIEYLAK